MARKSKPWLTVGVHDPAPAKLLLELFCEERTVYAELPDDFDSRWKGNVQMVLASVEDRFERKAWAGAFRWSKEAWREAYMGRGSNRLALLAESDPTLTEDEGDVAWAA